MSEIRELARRLDRLTRQVQSAGRSASLTRASVVVDGVEVDVATALLAAQLASEDLPTLEERLVALEDAVADTGWVALTFDSGWVNFGGGYNNLGYRRIGPVVYLRGMVKRDGIAAPAGDVITTLPAGSRPSARHIFGRQQTKDVTAGVAENLGRVDIGTSGDVLYMDDIGAADWLNLDGITLPL